MFGANNFALLRLNLLLQRRKEKSRFARKIRKDISANLFFIGLVNHIQQSARFLITT